MPHILIIDDDAALAAMLAQYLERENFEITLAPNGESGLEIAAKISPDAIVLDVMMPGMDGIAVLRKVRDGNNVPVIMLTAKGHDEDRILGLELGADDYIAKPFNPRELTARVRAVLRRHAFAYRTPSVDIVLGSLCASTTKRKALWNNLPLPLTGVEFRILEAMMRAENGLKSRDELSEIILGRQHQPFDRSIDVHVSNLRKKIAQVCESGVVISAVRGRGYRIEVDG